jgi:hypothetical protein
MNVVQQNNTNPILGTIWNFSSNDTFSQKLETRFHNLLAQLETDLTSNVSLGSKINSRAETIFNLRADVLDWYGQHLTNEEFAKLSQDFLEKHEVYPHLETLGMLLEQAIKQNIVLLDIVMDNIDIGKSIKDSKSKDPKINYQKFTQDIALSLNQSLGQVILNGIAGTIAIEYVMLAYQLIHNKKLKISKTKIKQLETQTLKAIQKQQRFINLIVKSMGAEEEVQVANDMLNLSLSGLNAAFSEEEEEFDDYVLIYKNPKYKS